MLLKIIRSLKDTLVLVLYRGRTLWQKPFGENTMAVALDSIKGGWTLGFPMQREMPKGLSRQLGVYHCIGEPPDMVFHSSIGLP